MSFFSLNKDKINTFDKILEKRGFGNKYINIITKWDLIIKKDYLQYTYPVKIKWNNKNQGDLHIKLSSSKLKNSLIHDSNLIINNIKQILMIDNIVKITILSN